VDVFIPPDSQRRLIQLSRRTLNDFVRGIERTHEEIDDLYLESRDYGAFVSLHRQEELRGCIGHCTPNIALSQVVIEMTQAAASRDSRVTPILESELDEIRIEITVLSPLTRVADPWSLEIGKHGLFVEHRHKRGVLLPQVATRYNWDVKTFLQQTCVKAGLRKNAWKRATTEISSFTALIIEE
jgi:AmmeMemoRadiSam system protein A